MSRTTLLTVCLLAASGSVLAADWPQWQGPNRDNVSLEKGLLDSWPEGGPKLLWTFEEAGEGYSAPAVVGNRTYLMGGRDDKDYVFALDVQNGKEVWAAEIGPLYRHRRGDGTRGTPTVDGEYLYALGGQGNLICVHISDGKEVWRKSFTRDLGSGRPPGYGFASSPLIDGDHVIGIPGGGRRGGGGSVAALNKRTGEVVWRSKDFTDGAQYASLRVSEAGGVRQYVVLTRTNVAGIAAKDGALLWKFPRQSPTAACSTPLVQDNYVYVTTGYGRGCTFIKLTRAGEGFKAEEVYGDKQRNPDNVMENHHGGVVLIDGYVYGHSNRGGWKCQEFLTGKEVWKSGELPKGSLTCADGKLYCYSERDGTCALVDPNPKGWKEVGRFRIPKRVRPGKVWTHPVVANGRLYLRDQNLFWCYDVRKN